MRFTSPGNRNNHSAENETSFIEESSDYLEERSLATKFLEEEKVVGDDKETIRKENKKISSKKHTQDSLSTDIKPTKEVVDVQSQKPFKENEIMETKEDLIDIRQEIVVDDQKEVVDKESVMTEANPEETKEDLIDIRQEIVVDDQNEVVDKESVMTETNPEEAKNLDGKAIGEIDQSLDEDNINSSNLEQELQNTDCVKEETDDKYSEEERQDFGRKPKITEEESSKMDEQRYSIIMDQSTVIYDNIINVITDMYDKVYSANGTFKFSRAEILENFDGYLQAILIKTALSDGRFTEADAKYITEIVHYGKIMQGVDFLYFKDCSQDLRNKLSKIADTSLVDVPYAVMMAGGIDLKSNAGATKAIVDGMVRLSFNCLYLDNEEIEIDEVQDVFRNIYDFVNKQGIKL